MAFDAYFLTAVLDEIREKAIGARVEKIHQPSRDTVILLLRCEQGREKLLFAANPAAPRLHMTTANPENPPEPPMFCMLLRKHLQGARLASITQPPMERAATFRFDCTDEMGYPVQKSLVAELMGRTCNLYLLGPDGHIIDCLRRIGLDETTKRPALPGLCYQEPEQVQKQNPLEWNQEDYVNLLSQPGSDVLADRLMFWAAFRLWFAGRRRCMPRGMWMPGWKLWKSRKPRKSFGCSLRSICGTRPPGTMPRPMARPSSLPSVPFGSMAPARRPPPSRSCWTDIIL